jgi:hypothetical protein
VTWAAPLPCGRRHSGRQVVVSTVRVGPRAYRRRRPHRRDRRRSGYGRRHSESGRQPPGSRRCSESRSAESGPEPQATAPAHKGTRTQAAPGPGRRSGSRESDSESGPDSLAAYRPTAGGGTWGVSRRVLSRRVVSPSRAPSLLARPVPLREAALGASMQGSHESKVGARA